MVHYDHSNEFACFARYTNVENGEKLAFERLYRIYAAVRAVDPTRPGSSDADGDLGGRLPDFNVHYAMEQVNNLVVNGRLFLTPVDAFNFWFKNPRADYVPQQGDVIETSSNGLPLTWRWGTRPWYGPEVLWCPGSSLPHGGTYWRGDSVYRSVEECYQAEEERVINLLAGHRHIEPWLLHQWTGDERCYKGMQPVCVIPIESLHNYYSRETAIRHVNIHHDRLVPGRLTLRWGVAWNGHRRESGREKLSLEAGDLVRRTLKFALPKVRTPTDAALFYRLEDTGREVFATEQAVTIFPRQPVTVATNMRVALWDPAGTSRDKLAKLGVEIIAVTDPRSIPHDAVLLVVGDGAWTQDTAKETTEAVFDYAANGGSVVMLHQTHWPKQFPVQTKQDPQHVASRVWKRAPAHPVFRDIADGWLRDWRETHVVSSFDLTKPLLGNAIALADSGRADGLERCALLEVRHGNGRILASQFRLLDAFDAEPVAPKLLARLLEAASTPPAPLHSVGVCAAPDSAAFEMLELVGAAPIRLAGPLSTVRLDQYEVVLAQLGESFTKEEAGLLHQRALAGATVWVRGAGLGNRELLEIITGGSWKEVEPLPLWRGRCLITAAAPELAGLSNAEFYWKRGQFGASEGLEDPAWAITDMLEQHLVPVGPASATELLYPSAMCRVPVGKGRVLVDEVLWAEKVADVRNQATRIASMLLANLGVKLSPAKAVTLLPEDTVWLPVDLSPFGNMGFADETEGDGKGGWSDQGPRMDMRRLPTGDVVFNGVPFHIDAVKGCLTMRGDQQSKREAFPLAFRGIPIHRKLLGLELLHAGAWVGGSVEVFQMIVNYEDGSTQRVNFVDGINTRDWTAKTPPAAFPAETDTQTRCGWTGQGDVFECVSVWQSRWVNPFPEKKVVSVDFVHDVTRSVAMVCGLTLGVSGTASRAEQDTRTPAQLLDAAREARAAGRIREAISVAQVLCRQAAGSTENWNLLGALHLEEGDRANALKAYRKSLDLQPNQPNVMTKVQELQQAIDATQ